MVEPIKLNELQNVSACRINVRTCREKKHTYLPSYLSSYTVLFAVSVFLSFLGPCFVRVHLLCYLHVSSFTHSIVVFPHFRESCLFPKHKSLLLESVSDFELTPSH